MTVERATEIAAPPAAVFAALADPATHLEWRPSALEFRALDGGPLRRGSRLEEVVRFAGRRYRTLYEVSGFDAPRLLALRSLEGPVPLELRCSLEALSSGTRLVFRLDARPRLPRTARPFFRLLMRWYLADEARRLKRLVEAGADTA